MTEAEAKQRLREEIMITVKANQLPVTAELWLGLVFLDLHQLTSIAQTLNIRTQQSAIPAH